MEKEYNFHINPNKKQEDFIQLSLDCYRFVYNGYLAMHIEAYKKDEKAVNYTIYLL